MKKKSKFFRILGLLLLLLIALVVAVIFYADHIIVIGVETAGTSALDSPTTLDKAKLSILGGSLTLNGLTVANPQGYQTDNLVHLGECSAAVDLKSLTTDTIKVKQILLKDMVLTIEQKGLTSNLKDILDKINAQQKDKEPKKEQKKETPEKEEAPGKKVLVEKIEIIGAKAKIKLLPLPGKKDAMDIKLAPIVLENVSQDQNKAVMLSTIIQKVLLAVAQATVQSGIELPGALLEGLKGSMDKLNTALGDVALGIAKGTEKIIKDTGKIIEQTGKGLEEVIKAPGKMINSGQDPCAVNPLEKGTKKLLDDTGKALEKTGKGLEGILKKPGELFKKKESDK